MNIGDKMLHSRTSYLFVDGACLRAEVGRISERYTGEVGRAKISWPSLSADFTKVFYYDALPTRDTGEDEASYAERNAQILQLHEALRQLDRFHVYEGDRRRARGRGERAQQKKVDVMIAVDMLMHTFRRNMHEATLIASDLDFAPLLHALIQEGMYVTLWYPPAATNAELQASADSRRHLTAKGMGSALIDVDNRPFLPSWIDGVVHYRQQPFENSWPMINNQTVTLHGDGNTYLCEITHSSGFTTSYAAHHDRRVLLFTAEERLGAKLPKGAY